MLHDELNALLLSRAWVTRRVDRVEFLDLMAVRRTIALTLDLERLAGTQWRRRGSSTVGRRVPLGWFVPWANAGAVLVDADGRIIPYLTSGESDRVVEPLIVRRLRALGIDDPELRVKAVVGHRQDPGRPGDRCNSCKGAGCSDGHQDLMVEKWGCRAVLSLLRDLREADPHRDDDTSTPAKELARLVMAWQRNFVLFACLDSSKMQRGRVTLRLSYDEELLEWEPPWEHRRRLVLKPEGRECRQPVECRAYISRGGPFAPDLDLLAPRGRLSGMLARSGSPHGRKLGRHGPLQAAWHVAWHQASGIDVPDHHVDVILPNELTVVRLRMLRIVDGIRCATVGDQAGSHATIVAPELCERSAHRDGWSPTLFSLVIAQRSPSAWYGGAWIALLTAIALFLVACLWLPAAEKHVEPAVAALLLAPTLVAAALSVRAGSEIAEQLTTALRGLIASVSVLAATCAITLVAHRGPLDPSLLESLRGTAPANHHLALVTGVWIGVAFVLLLIAVALCCGGRRIRSLLDYGRRPAPRYVQDCDPGHVLNPKQDPRDRSPKPPRIGPPDCWLNADEGDLVPWGWLNGAASFEISEGSDRHFWLGYHPPAPKQLIEWVQNVADYQEPAPPHEPCPGCRC